MAEALTDRIRDASWDTYDGRHRLIRRGDALAILGKTHPLRAEVEGMPCLGRHSGYCAGVVVDADAIVRALAAIAGEQP